MTEVTYLDPKVIYADELDDWKLYWDNSKSLYQNVINLCSQCVALPRQDLQLPIAAIYTLVPSKWAKILPILFSWGDRGTGKTTFAILAAKLHGQHQLFSSADTFASIRNALDAQRWMDEEKEFEKEGAILCWDNVSRETFLRDEKIYQMMLFGYNRASERILLAQPDGTNREYRVFCPKIISSVQPLHTFFEFEEMNRRLLIIRHKQFEKLTKHDLQHLPIDFSITDRLDLDSISWEGIEENFFRFWTDEENCKAYARFRKLLTRKGSKSFTLPSEITGEKWTILIDLICTGLVIGAFQDIQQAVNHFGAYFDWIASMNSVHQLNAFRLIEAFLEEKFSGIIQQREILKKSGFPTDPLRFVTKDLKNFLNSKQVEGALDINPNNRELVKDIMRSLGFRLAGMYWEEIID